MIRTGLLLLAALTATASASEPVSGWPIADANYDQEKMTALDQAVTDGTYKKINSVIVIRSGELLIERYYNGATRNQTHDPRSVGKTFAATILGIAIDDGYIESIDQRLGDFYDLKRYENYSDKKAQVTLRHLVTMTSGFDGFDFDTNSVGNEGNMYATDDWVKWALDLPMADDRDPGEEWRYFTAGAVILGDILNSALPGGLESYAHRKLFDRIGVSDYEWQHTPTRVASTAGGIQLTPLDFAKFGELHRNRGLWMGEAVVPADWVDAIMLAQVETTIPDNKYGFLWWHKSYVVENETWPVTFCVGNGGNKILVFHDQNLVVVLTASAYDQPYMYSQIDEILMRYVLPAVSNQQ